MISQQYPAYLKEYQNQEIIETEYGFVSYILCPDTQTLYIVDVYVVPERRKEYLGTELIELVKEVAKSNGCTLLVTHVYLNYHKKEESLLTSLCGGAYLAAADPEKITLAMDV